MSLVFGAASGDRVSHGSAASLGNLAQGGALTVWAWVRRTGDGNNQHIATKDASLNGWLVAAVNGAGEGALRAIVWRPTRTDYTSVSGVLPLNTWVFVAFTYTAGAGSEIVFYAGSLGATVAAVANAATQNGSGTPADDAAANLWLGNLERAPTNPFLGNIARAGVIARALTLAELRAIQFASVPGANVAGTKLLVAYAGTGAQPDYSGGGNAGTISGATAGAGLPLGAWFGADLAPSGFAATTTAVGADSALAWQVRAATSRDLALAWAVRALVNADRAAAWHDRATVSGDKALVWAVRTIVNADKAATWHDRALAGASRAAAWQARATTGRDAALAWHVLGVLASVGADLGMAWQVRALVAGDVALGWHLRATVAADASAAWHDRQTTARDLAAAWAVRVAAGQDAALAWRQRAAVGASATLAWGVVGSPVTPRRFAATARALVYRGRARTFEHKGRAQ